MYACVHACVWERENNKLYVHVYVCVRVYVHACVHACVGERECICVYVCVCCVCGGGVLPRIKFLGWKLPPLPH